MTEPGKATTPDPAPDPEEEKEQTLLEQMGGISGLIYSSVPVLVFVLLNALFGLTVAIWGSLASAAAITVLRVVRKEPLQPAISGFFGVGIAAFIAYRTGSAKGFFLFGIWASLVYGSVFGASILVRYPLVGVIWSFLNGHGMAWRSDRKAMFAYNLATLTWVLVFAARFIVQRWLYDEDQTGWLAFARLAMGYPLTAIALVVTVWAVTRAGHRVKKIEADAEAEDRAIEERLRAKYSGKPEPEGA
ncbi:MAG: DUF3159 domain-containing protein [Actinomycetota bacterium]|nr:DUF3159 domain-containing protein [Actinomycetota bacterium]